MRNTVSTLAIAAVMAAGMATTALADVTVFVSVSKDKDVTVSETLTVSKDIEIDVTVDLTLDGAAEAMALVNQTVDDNLVDRDVDPVIGSNIGDDDSIVRAALIGETLAGSVSGNQGATGVNQDVGAMSNQGNIWSIALAEDDPADPGNFTDAQAEVDQETTDNTVDWDGTDNEGGAEIIVDANIEDSINDNIGLTAVNQNAGNMNNQVNAVAVAAGVFGGTTPRFDGAAVALAEAALGQLSTGNTVDETAGETADTVPVTLPISKTAGMAGSVTGNTGITQVNQSVGNMGNQGNVAAVAAAVLGPQL